MIIVRVFNHMIGNFIRKIKALLKIRKIVNMESYYPEIKRKSKTSRYFENIKWILKYSEPNIFYNLYGMDTIKKININSYCSNFQFMRERNKYNLNPMTYKRQYNYIAILRDKNLFEKYMKSIDVNTATTIAIIKDGVIFDSNLDRRIEEKDIFNLEKNFFVKSVGGECADGVFYIKNYETYIKMKEKFSKGIFIIQKKLIQNEKMNQLNPKSINTIRAVTINNGENVKILAVVCRLGTNKSGFVDNWAAGGISVEVKEDGKLEKYGFYKPGFGIKVDKHPDTGIVFENFEIPYFKEAKDIILRAHKSLYGIHSIGWDIAITKEGPVLIEGNDNWEISLMQTYRGLKQEWIKSFRKKENKGSM